MEAVTIVVVEIQEASQPTTHEAHQYAVTNPTTTNYSPSTAAPDTAYLSSAYSYSSPVAASTSAVDPDTGETFWYTLVNPSSSSSSSSSLPSTFASPSASYSPTAYSSSTYNNGYIAAGQSNYTSVNSTSAQGNTGTEEESSGLSPLVKPIAAAVGAAVVVAAVITIWLCCCKRRRAKRSSRLSGEEQTTGSVMGQRSSMAVARQQRNLTRDELFDVVPLPPPLARYSRIAPSPPDGLIPPPLTTLRSNRLSSVTSSWADDSEIDALATDGSTIARTISTHSISSRLSEGTVTGTVSDNPFDHPAYTLISGTPRRTRTTPGTSTLNSSGQTGSDTMIPTSDPFSDIHAPLTEQATVDSPISPVSPAYLPSSRSHLDDLFGSPSGNDLDQGATIIQHIDGGRAVPRRAALPEPERVGQGEVHIPPTYMELYPGRNGQ